MEKDIKKFPAQFGYVPTFVNSENLKPWSRVVLCGMGGSRLIGDIMRILDPRLDIFVHASYGLPMTHSLEETLYVASSYSGNTEETLDVAEKAHTAGGNVSVLTAGGRLAEFAKENRLPHIEFPNDGIQPRIALGYSAIGLTTILGNAAVLSDLRSLASSLKPEELEREGDAISKKIAGKIPVICASHDRRGIAYVWKIKFNETAKVPAFCSVFPELNHNEMVGFDVIEPTKGLSEKFCFVFLTDPTDHPKIQKRMTITKALYEKRGFSVIESPLAGVTAADKIFGSLVRADWASFLLSRYYGTEPEKVVMIEEFKKMIKE